MPTPLSKWIPLALLAFAAAVPAHAMGGFAVTNLPIPDFAGYAATPGAQKLVGDFNGDGMADIALSGPADWHSIPIAFSNGDGSFNVTNAEIGDFGHWAGVAGARILVGDFNDDGKADVALAGAPAWGSVPVAFSNGDGSFTVTNINTTFASWAKLGGALLLVGDYNDDGRADIAVGGPIGLPVIPVAFSNGDGSFNVTSATSSFPGYAGLGTPKTLVGDFNGDGRADLALTGATGWGSIPVAFSNGDGTFDVTNASVSYFPGWAATTGAKIFVGDWNGDGKTDLGVAGASGWHSVPLAFSNGDGTWNVTNGSAVDFAWQASLSGDKILVGDFNHDGKADVATIGDSALATLPVIFSQGDGTYYYTNQPVVGFAGWATLAPPLTGDFNGDGRMDVALTGYSGWGSVPVAFSLSQSIP